ncbi:proline/glycine betaine ABC transporter permease [Lacticaseibacillus pabuli]|uniref:Proline/glycine betaine ABC transporter permease n=1 Tax=Lacticaseibacillus pabuli TaxID=3025672 RepID=A0ABY7WWA8_9LACO|nr:proline/glycine betaine ABC transporter permease [Lacticaseibacillus sp. KACC 23028]WDF83334.1 proline/glycine betaine ABC transporter permease [Lacticaseibacillus sp. KACC 23028]
MGNLLMLSALPKIPMAGWIDNLVNWLADQTGFFNAITNFVGGINAGIQWFFDMLPLPLLIVLVVGLTAWLSWRKGKLRWSLVIFELIGMLFIWNQGYWRDMTQTLALVLTSSIIALVIGIPLGIWMAKSEVVQTILKPILDFMQTMPAFVYLIPAVALFGIGAVPGVFSALIFAMPPVVRMTNLGIRGVPSDLTEAADAYGSTSWQKLIKVELPLASSSIMAGVNQTMMLSLSMVVTASMIGAMGLGSKVYFAVGRNDAGNGFTAGLAIVIIAIVLDRITQMLNSPRKQGK